MKINPIGHLVKTNPIQTQNKAFPERSRMGQFKPNNLVGDSGHADAAIDFSFIKAIICKFRTFLIRGPLKIAFVTRTCEIFSGFGGRSKSPQA